jgi:hypothetical protein
MIENRQITLADISRNELQLAAYLRGKVPDANLSEGSSLYDLVVRPISYALTLIESEARDVADRSTLNLLAAKEDVSSRLALDDLLSNWFIARRPGGISTGVATLEFSSKVTFTLDSSTVFSRGSVYSFSPTSSYIRTINSSELSTKQTSTGVTYYIRIGIASNIPGLGSLMPAGDLTSNKSLPSLIKIYTLSPTSEVSSIESNGELVSRAKDSLSFRGMTTPASIKATIGDLNLSDITNIQVIRSGDPEMFMDKIPGSSTIRRTGVGIITLLSTLYRSESDLVYSGTEPLNTDIDYYTVDKQESEAVSLIYSVIDSNGATLNKVHFHPAKLTYGDSGYVKVSIIPGGTTPILCEAVESNELSETEFIAIESAVPAGYGKTTEVSLVSTSSSVTPAKASILVSTQSVQVEDLAKSEDLAPACGKLYVSLQYHVQVFIRTIRYVKNPNSPIEVPEDLIKSSVAQLISSSKSGLSVGSIVSHIMLNFYQFVISVDPDITAYYYLSGMIPYKTSTTITVEDTSKQILPDTGLYQGTSYLYSSSELLGIGVSDRTCRLFCTADDISMEAV